MVVLLTHILLSQSGLGTRVTDKTRSKLSDMGVRDTIKGGLTPTKAGKPISLRGDHKGINQVAGWVGKGKPTSNTQDALSHASAPLETLKDPASFGPPPKHVNRAPVNSTGPAPGSYSQPKPYETVGRHAFPESKVLATAPPPGSWGAPLSASVVHELEGPSAEEEAEKPKAPAVPYRANTTGLETANLPRPPTFRGEILEDGRVVPQPAAAARASPAPPPARGPKPTPPPRLPQRQNSRPDEFSPAPPPSYTEAQAAPPPQQTPAAPSYLNKASLNRLGQSGVSVPGFNIGRTAFPATSAAPASERPAATSPPSQMGELTSRFGRMGAGTTSTTPQHAPQGGGTTWAQKREALNTASKFHQDPSSVSFSDARAAGSTMNNFRERHGEQVASGLKQAQGLDQRYGVSGKVGGLTGQQLGQTPETVPTPVVPTPVVPTPVVVTPPPASFGAIGKKAPPPPPKKKELSVASEGPPPIPLSSKPRG